MDGPPEVGQARAHKRPFPQEDEERKEVCYFFFAVFFFKGTLKSAYVKPRGCAWFFSAFTRRTCKMCTGTTATTRRTGKSSIPAGSQLLPLLLQGTRAATPEPSPYQPRAAPPAGHRLVHADSLATHPSPPSASLSPPPCKVESLLPSSSSHHRILGF